MDTKKCGLLQNDLIVDIGSNDGTTLKAFKDIGFNVQGIDPASLPSNIANQNGIPTINAFFDVNVVKHIIKELGHADFITSQNVLAHVEDLKGVFENIYNLLKENGFFCFEIGYFGDVLKNGLFDTIYHEHIDYHHTSPLVRLLSQIGFDTLDVSLNNIQGGSLRILTQKTNKGNISLSVSAFIKEEKLSLLYDQQFLNSWQSKIDKNMTELNKRVNYYKSLGKTIIAYGAPTKLVLFFKMAKLNLKNIDFIVDDNAHKVGKFIPSVGIEIKPVLDLTLHKDKVIIIIAWNFAEDIINKLKLISNDPFDVIIPLPVLKEINIC